MGRAIWKTAFEEVVVCLRISSFAVLVGEYLDFAGSNNLAFLVHCDSR